MSFSTQQNAGEKILSRVLPRVCLYISCREFCLGCFCILSLLPCHVLVPIFHIWTTWWFCTSRNKVLEPSTLKSRSSSRRISSRVRTHNWIIGSNTQKKSICYFASCYNLCFCLSKLQQPKKCNHWHTEEAGNQPCEKSSKGEPLEWKDSLQETCLYNYSKYTMFIIKSFLHSFQWNYMLDVKAISQRTPERKNFSPLMLWFPLFQQLHHQHEQTCSPTLREKLIRMWSN